MKLRDYLIQGRRGWVRLHAKSAKEHDVPCHHKLKAYLDAHLAAAGPAADPDGPLLRTTGRKTGQPHPPRQQEAYSMVQRRARAAGIKTKLDSPKPLFVATIELHQAAMRFEWDENKRQSNIAKHGIDFLLVSQMFDVRPCLDFASPRATEQRALRIGELNGRVIAVAWMWRGENVVRIISARRARDGDERAYRQLPR
jgi:uncharacterized DUF497 family protein